LGKISKCFCAEIIKFIIKLETPQMKLTPNTHHILKESVAINRTSAVQNDWQNEQFKISWSLKPHLAVLFFNFK
jgi:hypothetical protein